MRIIGEAPPLYGGRIARSTVKPEYKGECVLKFVHGDIEKHARFVNYSVARTAATMAIFANTQDIDHVVLSHSDACSIDDCCKIYSSAKLWFSDLK